MVCCKRILIFFTIFLLIVGISSFSWCAENVEYEIAPNLQIISFRNYFSSSNTVGVGYVTLETGYIYHLTNTGTVDKNIAVSSEAPSLNGVYTYLYQLPPEQTYDFLASSTEFLFFDFSPAYSTGAGISLTRERVGSMDTVVQELANVVSPNQLWNVLNDSIPYVLIVVVVGFGFYIIFKLIKKFSKGKSVNI